MTDSCPSSTPAALLPPWLKSIEIGRVHDHVDAVGLSLDLARRNVEERTGGPFGAVVYAPSSGDILGIGLNLVETSGLAVWHAEVVAITNAQRKLGKEAWNVGHFALACSCQPCLMCLGVAHWSRIKEIYCSATSGDAEAIGFDEGPSIEPAVIGLRRRGVVIERGVRRDEGREVLRLYSRMGGTIY